MKYLKQIFERKMLPGEMEKESSLHKKISKAPFIKQYGKERGKKIYYATIKNMAMKEDRCPCEDDAVILEKEGKKARGSPWFIDKETRNNNPHTSRKRIPRNHPNRSKMTSSQISARKRIGNKLKASYRKRGMKLSDPSPSDPAKTVEEIIWATATKAALSGSSGLKKKNKKGPTRFEKKIAKKKSEEERKKKSVRDAMERIRQQRKS